MDEEKQLFLQRFLTFQKILELTHLHSLYRISHASFKYVIYLGSPYEKYISRKKDWISTQQQQSLNYPTYYTENKCTILHKICQTPYKSKLFCKIWYHFYYNLCCRKRSCESYSFWSKCEWHFGLFEQSTQNVKLEHSSLFVVTETDDVRVVAEVDEVDRRPQFSTFSLFL